jgi:hypothetical protein
MDHENEVMGGGHCFGFAALTEELFKRRVSALGPGDPFSYSIAGNSSLQRAIAEAYAHQDLPSVINATIGGLNHGETPNQVLDALRISLDRANSETYSLGMYRFGPGGDILGGHEVTPFAVADAGGGVFQVQVYDNNFPGQTRAVIFDTNKNTYSYESSENPAVQSELYTGGANDHGVELDPITQRQSRST